MSRIATAIVVSQSRFLPPRPVTAGFPPQREAEKRLRPPRSEYESRKIQWERDPPLTMKELQELDRL